MKVTGLVLAVCLAATTISAQVPSDAVLRKEAGNHYLKLRDYVQSREQYLAALQIDPNYEDAHYNLAIIYFFRLGDPRRALYHFARYAQLAPHASDLDQVLSLSRQALKAIEAEEREAYAAALNRGTPNALASFLVAHPGSYYEGDAKEKIRLLQQ